MVDRSIDRTNGITGDRTNGITTIEWIVSLQLPAATLILIMLLMVIMMIMMMITNIILIHSIDPTDSTDGIATVVDRSIDRMALLLLLLI
jgi:hypothetical protein